MPSKPPAASSTGPPSSPLSNIVEPDAAVDAAPGAAVQAEPTNGRRQVSPRPRRPHRRRERARARPAAAPRRRAAPVPEHRRAAARRCWCRSRGRPPAPQSCRHRPARPRPLRPWAMPARRRPPHPCATKCRSARSAHACVCRRPAPRRCCALGQSGGKLGQQILVIVGHAPLLGLHAEKNGAAAMPPLLDEWTGWPPPTAGRRNQRSRILGSSASRSASPKRLKPNTVTAIARPGKIAIHGAVEAYSSAPPCSIRPQAGTGSCTPSPR